MVVAVSKNIDEVNYCTHFKLRQSPLPREFDSNNFYGGGSRQSVFEDLVIRIQRDDACILIEATAGSGKTAICKMVEQEMDVTCLYVNCSKNHHISLEKQIAQGLLIEDYVFIPNIQIENMLMDKLKIQDQLVIMVENVIELSEKQFSWLARLQEKIADAGNNLSVVLFYSAEEQKLIPSWFFSEKTKPLKLLSLTDYEAYEYLNTHMYHCGARDITLFQRNIAVAISNESLGNIRKISELASITLRNAYLRGAEIPGMKDLPFKPDVKRIKKTIDINRSLVALETVRNTLIIGAIAGGTVLLLIWGLLGPVNVENEVVVLDTEKPSPIAADNT